MSTPIALEILLGFGVPIGWGLWELYALRREKARDRALDQAKAQANAAAEGAATVTPAAASETAAASEPTAH